MELKKTTKYPEFSAMKDLLDARHVNYQKDLDRIMPSIIRRENGENFSISEHLSGIVFSLLSSQRKWTPIEKNRNNITKIFHDFDPNYLKTTDPEIFIKEIKDIKCGNLHIVSQMRGLKQNVEILEKIAARYGSVDQFYNTKPVEDLIEILSSPKSEYKMQNLGPALAAEYLKTVGLPTEKPDIHVRRIIARWGYAKSNLATLEEAHSVCQDIAKAYDIPIAVVDLLIWHAGSSGIFA